MFKYGIVIDVNDNFDGDRIKIHIKGVDPVKYVKDDLPFAFPLLPKTIYTKPKIGETVLVFSQDDTFINDRFWLGPIISQPHKLNYDSLTAQSFLKSGLISPEPAPSQDPNNLGVQLQNDDVGLQGRGSTDITVKPDEIRLRAGKTLDMRTFNKKNPVYIQTKYDRNTNNGVINLVSDYINILSHNGIDKFNLSNPNSLISDDEFNNIIEKAHQLPYGDILIQFMEIFLKAFYTHVHPYAGLPPDSNQIELKKLSEYDLNKILSKYIRIN